jgi:hypothetical protein
LLSKLMVWVRIIDTKFSIVRIMAKAARVADVLGEDRN